MYQMTAKVRMSEADHTKTITFPAIVNYFQDCSTFQSEALGVGFAHLEARKKAWVLNAWQIEVDRYPAIGEEVTVSTWSTGFDKLYGYRNFLMCDKEGRHLAWANSVWVFMDLEKGRPVRPEAWDIAVYGEEEALPMAYAPRKIKLAGEGTKAEPYPVRKSDIDPNEHVNNCRYIQMALDALPEETGFRQVRVEYKKSAVAGDIIYPWIARESERILVLLCDGGKKPYAVVELMY